MTAELAERLLMQSMDRELTAMLQNAGSPCTYAWVRREELVFVAEHATRHAALVTRAMCTKWQWPTIFYRDHAMGWMVVCRPTLPTPKATITTTGEAI